MLHIGMYVWHIVWHTPSENKQSWVVFNNPLDIGLSVGRKKTKIYIAFIGHFLEKENQMFWIQYGLETLLSIILRLQAFQLYL